MQAYEIKLSDFGLAKLVADGYSIATTRTGTPQYWAPEVATSLGHQRSEKASAGGYGFSADLWSMGVVLYVMLCGRYPFTGDARKMEMDQSREGNDETEIAGTAVAAALAERKVLLIKYLFTSMQK